MAIKEDLINTITSRMIERLEGEYYNYSIEQLERIQNTLNAANIEQLWSLYKFTERSGKFKVLPGDPTDHLAFTSSGMYIGIEPDGYTHS